MKKSLQSLVRVLALAVGMFVLTWGQTAFAGAGGGRVVNLVTVEGGTTFFTDTIPATTPVNACRDGFTRYARFYLSASLASYRPMLAIVTTAFFMDMPIGYQFWTSEGDACQITHISASRAPYPD